MDLKSGCPYFLLKDGFCGDFEILQSDLSTEVLVLGGGISGALIAHQLIRNGIDCTVIDKRKIGLGSTCASTSLLQYEIDVPLFRLSEKIGRERAIKAYHLCSGAIDRIREIAEEVNYPDFKYCDSVYFSHTGKRNEPLRKEFRSRQEAGFSVHYLDSKELLARYGLLAEEAIVSRKAATISAYLFAQYLHRYALSKSARVFENTSIEKINVTEKGTEIITDKGFRVKAKKIVYATGYEAVEQISKPIVRLKSTFACVTDRIHGLQSSFENTVFWNNDDPYFYLREDKGRLIIGGRDENFYDPRKREKLLEKKAHELEKDFKGFFPGFEISSQFVWAGVFGATKDGLPYIGTYDKKPGSYFALGFGGNGITFSALAADIIVNLIKGNSDAVPEIFRFNR